MNFVAPYIGSGIFLYASCIFLLLFYILKRLGAIISIGDPISVYVLFRLSSMFVILYLALRSLNQINANLLIDELPSSIIKEIEEAIYISERRWNIKMKNGLNLKLAENKISESINNYIKIYRKITNDELQNIESIDLRIKNKAIIKFIERDND